MFTLGFSKVSSDTNNQGLEFKNADTNNATANVGPGGMSPQGIESYQAVEKEPGTKKKEKKLNPAEVGALFMQKGAAVGAQLDRFVSDNSTAEGVSSGLKYDQTTPEPQVEKDDKKLYKRRRAYIRGGIK